MHPIERLRMVARAGDEDPIVLAHEAAAALAGLAEEPAALVMACRRLVGRQPWCGPLWWVATRVVSCSEPRAEALRLSEELDLDQTPRVLAEALPYEATVAVVRPADQCCHALRDRADLAVFAIGAVRASTRHGSEWSAVPPSGLGQAVAASDIVLLEADALGDSGLAARPGSLAAAAVGGQTGVPVWVVAGVGTVLPSALWEAAQSRLLQSTPPGHGTHDIVPARLVDRVVGPDGVGTVESALHRGNYPAAPELTRRAPAPGSAVG